MQDDPVETIMEKNRNVLFISYLFPPIGGSGVQRNLKYAKYLPTFGWQPLVITVKDIQYHQHDYSLLNEVSPKTPLFRTESIDPLRIAAVASSLRHRKIREASSSQNGTNEFHPPSKLLKIYRSMRDFFAFPDMQIGWIPFAIFTGIKLTHQHDYQLIFARSAPLSGTIATYILSKITRRPYILDFADGWTDDPHLSLPTRLHKKGHAWLERLIVGHANHVIVYSRDLAERFQARYPQLSERISILPNGYDPEDFEGITPASKKNDQIYRIVYMGSLYEHHTTNFLTLLKALRDIPNEALQKLEVLFIGHVNLNVDDYIKQYALTPVVKFLGYKPHAEALEYLASADATLLFIKDGDKTMVTGKLFEYIGIKRPIIAIIEPDGLAADILHQVGMDNAIISPRDTIKTSTIITLLVQKGMSISATAIPEIFDRKQLTKQLASIFDKVLLKQQEKKQSRNSS